MPDEDRGRRPQSWIEADAVMNCDHIGRNGLIDGHDRSQLLPFSSHQQDQNGSLINPEVRVQVLPSFPE